MLDGFALGFSAANFARQLNRCCVEDAGDDEDILERISSAFHFSTFLLLLQVPSQGFNGFGKFGTSQLRENPI